MKTIVVLKAGKINLWISIYGIIVFNYYTGRIILIISVQIFSKSKN